MIVARRSSFALGAAVAFALLALPSPACAQFGLAVGVSVPRRDLQRESLTGYDVNGMFNAGKPGIPMAFRGEAGICSFSLKGLAAGTTRIVNLTGNILARSPAVGGVTPYVIAGIGLYRVNYSSGSRDYILPAQYPPVFGRNGSEGRVGFNGGAGISFPAGTHSLLLEMRYVSLATPSNKPSAGFIPIHLGFLF
jgi:hypothetical protein